MSTISQIYSSYGDALAFSREKYTDLYEARAQNAYDFYQAFFHKLIVSRAADFGDETVRRHIHRYIERFFGIDTVDFVAVDGTNKKIPFQDFIVFFACAYGAKGQVSLTNEPPTIRYQKWSLDRDVSMVTYIPIPFAEFADIADQDRLETFLVSDSDLVNLSMIDTRIMELAEIYLAYNVATSSAFETPRFIMLDRSPSSIIADVAFQPDTLPLIGYPYDRRNLTVADAYIAFAHPFNPSLGIPTLKNFRQYWALIAEFHHQRTKAINLAEFAHQNGVSVDDLKSSRDFFQSRARAGASPPASAARLRAHSARCRAAARSRPRDRRIWSEEAPQLACHLRSIAKPLEGENHHSEPQGERTAEAASLQVAREMMREQPKLRN